MEDSKSGAIEFYCFRSEQMVICSCSIDGAGLAEIVWERRKRDQAHCRWRLDFLGIVRSAPSPSCPNAQRLNLISLSEELDRCITRIAPELVKIRRHLHAKPELSGEELASTAFIGGRLTAAGVLHECGKERRGIITTISKSSPKLRS